MNENGVMSLFGKVGKEIMVKIHYRTVLNMINLVEV